MSFFDGVGWAPNGQRAERRPSWASVVCALGRSARFQPRAAAGASTETTVVLGSTATVPDPSCPELPCQAVGSVTGFQVSNDQATLPFRVPGKARSSPGP